VAFGACEKLRLPEIPREIAFDVEKLQRLDIGDKEERDRRGYSKTPQTTDEWLDSE
jgi:hypothetical protein